MTKEQYMKNVDEYNRSPNHCLHCGSPILCEYDQRLSDIKRKKFCNSSCSASYNNKGIIRNKNGIHGYKAIPEITKISNLSDDEIISFFNSSSNLKEFSQKLGYKNYISENSTFVFNKLLSLGIDLKSLKNKDVGKSTSNTCIVCGKELSHGNKSGYCHNCLIQKNNQDKIDNWIENGETGCSIGSTIRNCIRDYIYEDQNYKCAICGIDNIWNGKQLNFILDHIDGDASNNARDNLRLICSNCDSQLDTYKSKNKNSARNNRHKYYE